MTDNTQPRYCAAQVGDNFCTNEVEEVDAIYCTEHAEEFADLPEDLKD